MILNDIKNALAAGIEIPESDRLKYEKHVASKDGQKKKMIQFNHKVEDTPENRKIIDNFNSYCSDKGLIKKQFLMTLLAKHSILNGDK